MASDNKLLRLKTSDGVEFEVEVSVAILSETIKNMVEDDCASNMIPVPNVDGKIMAKVIAYCRQHADKTVKEEDLETFDKEFVDNLDPKLNHEEMYNLILAANYLNVKGLLDVLCKKVADMIKGKSPEETRETFNIENDFTPEQEEEYRQKHGWVFNKL